MTDQPNQLDLTTATPDQVEHMIWHLSEQRYLNLDQHAFLAVNDPTSPELAELDVVLDLIDRELAILKKHQRLVCN